MTTANKSEPQPGGAGARAEALMTGAAMTSIADTPNSEQGTLEGVPVAFASAFAPCARRRRWAISYRCPRCGGSHLGYSPDENAGGLRRSGCGRLVWLVIARRYGGAA